MGESNTNASAYTLCRHLQWYCPHPSISYIDIPDDKISTLFKLQTCASDNSAFFV